MNTTKPLIVATILGSLMLADCATAADSTTLVADANPDTTTGNADNAGLGYPLYRPQELAIDLFGSGSVGQETLDHFTGRRIRHDGLAGGGGGITYYFLRYLGVGGDYDAEGRAGHFFDSASGNIYARLPIADTGLAPYIFGGGGYQFKEVAQSFGQVGAGLEFRFCRHAGIFADARYVIAAQTDNYGMARAGVRITF